MHAKTDAKKVSKIDAKRIQNEAKIDAEIIDFSYFFEKGENAPDPVFSYIIRGSGYLKLHQKPIQNRCKIDAGKRHAKSMENDAKMEAKWDPKTMQEKGMQKVFFYAPRLPPTLNRLKRNFFAAQLACSAVYSQRSFC